MGDIPIDGKVRVAWVPAIANLAAPTVAELNAGILLQTIITADGLIGWEPDTADTPTTSLASVFNTVTNGRISFSGTMLRLKKQTDPDTVYTTLVKDLEGFIAIRRYIAQATGWIALQKLSTYPVICGELKELQPEENTVGRYEVPMKIRDEPIIRAVVA